MTRLDRRHIVRADQSLSRRPLSCRLVATSVRGYCTVFPVLPRSRYCGATGCGGCVRSVLMAVAAAVCALGASAPARAAWHAPVSISSQGVIPWYAAPTLAANARGDAIAVWIRRTGSTSFDLGPGRFGEVYGSIETYVVEAALRPAGRAWKKPVAIGTAHGFSIEFLSAAPELSAASDAQGRSAVVWTDPRYDRQSRQVSGSTLAATRTSAGRWTKPAVLFSDGRRTPFQPHVGLDQRGNATALWRLETVFVNSGDGIQTAFKPAGTPWRKPQTLARAGTDLQVAFNPRGDAIAIVEPQYAGAMQAYFRPVGKPWRRPVTIAAHTGIPSPVQTPEVALSPQGAAIVVFVTNGGAALYAWYSPAAGSRWGKPVALAHRVDYVQVGFDTHGNATAVWSTPLHVLRSALRPHNRSWRKPVVIFTGDPSPDAIGPDNPLFRDTRLAIDPRGDALAVWEDATSILATSRSPAGVWHKPVRISHTTGRAPQVALDAHGNAVAVWNHSLGGINSVIDAATLTRIQ